MLFVLGLEHETSISSRKINKWIWSTRLLLHNTCFHYLTDFFQRRQTAKHVKNLPDFSMWIIKIFEDWTPKKWLMDVVLLKFSDGVKINLYQSNRRWSRSIICQRWSCMVKMASWHFLMKQHDGWRSTLRDVACSHSAKLKQLSDTISSFSRTTIINILPKQ